MARWGKNGNKKGEPAKKPRLGFSIGKIIRPDADPDQIEDVGAVSNAIRYPADAARRRELKNLMSSSVLPERETQKPEIQELKAREDRPAVSSEPEERLDYERFLPTHSEEILRRDQLRPAPDDWNFFGRPSPDQYALIFQSIYRYGLWHPITVWEREDGRYMILGGHTRDLVYDELYQMTGDERYLEIPCKVYRDISEVTARRIVILSNIAQRAQESPKLRIRCYCEMARLEKMEAFYGSGIDTNAAVARLFGVSRATVFFYRKLEKLLDFFVGALERNEISRQAATTLSDLSEELQRHILDRGYYRLFTPALLRRLRTAGSEIELDRLFQQEAPRPSYRYTFSAAVAKPEGFDVLPLYVHHGDMDGFKALLRDFLEERHDTISEETRETVRNLLQS